MTIKERVAEDIKSLNEAELKQVAEYLAFLKFRAQSKSQLETDEAQLTALYAEFADEDRELAEEDLAEYAEGLAREDVRR